MEKKVNELSVKLTEISSQKRRLRDELAEAAVKRGEMAAELAKTTAEGNEMKANLDKMASECADLSKTNTRLRERLRETERDVSTLRKEASVRPEMVRSRLETGQKKGKSSHPKQSAHVALPARIPIISSPTRKPIRAPVPYSGSRSEARRRKSSRHDLLPEKLKLNIAEKGHEGEESRPSSKHRRQHSEWLRQAAAFAAEAIRQRSSSAALKSESRTRLPPSAVDVDKQDNADDKE